MDYYLVVTFRVSIIEQVPLVRVPFESVWHLYYSTAYYSCISDYKVYYNEHYESDNEYLLTLQKWQRVFIDISKGNKLNYLIWLSE